MIETMLLSPYADAAIPQGGIELGVADFSSHSHKSKRSFEGVDPDIDTTADKISRIHAVLFPQPAGVLIADFSLNGTLLNGRRIANAERPLISWDELAGTTIDLYSQCFRVRFVRITKMVIVGGQGKKRTWTFLPSNLVLYKMFLGFYKHPLPSLVIQSILPEEGKLTSNIRMDTAPVAQSVPDRPPDLKPGRRVLELQEVRQQLVASGPADVAPRRIFPSDKPPPD